MGPVLEHPGIPRRVVPKYLARPVLAGTLLWNNNLCTDGKNGRALSPPLFPNIRVVDDIKNDKPWKVTGLAISTVDDPGWAPGAKITVYVYRDAGNKPGNGALEATQTGTLARCETGRIYFSKKEYYYSVEGLNIQLPAGRHWIGARMPNGAGANKTNWWMTSNGGPDGGGTSTGYLSLDSGNTWNPEGAGWQHAFIVLGEVIDDPTGACCLPNGDCVENQTKEQCAERQGVWHQGKTCDEACLQPIGACCLQDGSCVENQTKEQCAERRGVWHKDKKCSQACPSTGACCLKDDCVENQTKPQCDARQGEWHQGETCDEACPSEGCNGKEVINKAKCKVKRGAVKKLIVKIKNGTPSTKYTAKLNTGQTVNKNANKKGKATFKHRGGFFASRGEKRSFASVLWRSSLMALGLGAAGWWSAANDVRGRIYEGAMGKLVCPCCTR